MPNDDDFDAVADDVFEEEAEGEEEEEQGQQASEEEEGSDTEDGGEEEKPAQEEVASPAQSQQAAAYDHNQLSDAVRRAVQERDQAYALERQRMALEMQQLKQQIQQAVQRPKQEAGPKLPSLEEWIQGGGDLNMYQYLEQMQQAQKAVPQVEQLQQEIDGFKKEQRQSQIEREISQHFDTSMEKAASESDYLKDDEGKGFLNNVIYAQSMDAMKRGIDPRRFDVVGAAKKFASYIDRMVEAKYKAKVKKVTKPTEGISHGKGSPTKATKKDMKYTTDDLLDSGIDDLITELGAFQQ